MDCIVLNETFCIRGEDHLIERIKSNRLSAKIPIVLYSNTLEFASAANADNFSKTDSYYKIVSDTLEKITEQENTAGINSAGGYMEGEVLKGKNILVVDDDMRNIYALTTILENEGAVLICAYDGKDAIEKLEMNPQIDLVLMDIMMPVMDGYQAMTAIRQDEKYMALPIIAVTAKAMAEDRDKCLNAGASDYITKPINNEVLMTKLKVWLYV